MRIAQFGSTTFILHPLRFSCDILTVRHPRRSSPSSSPPSWKGSRLRSDSRVPAASHAYGDRVSCTHRNHKAHCGSDLSHSMQPFFFFVLLQQVAGLFRQCSSLRPLGKALPDYIQFLCKDCRKETRVSWEHQRGETFSFFLSFFYIVLPGDYWSVRSAWTAVVRSQNQFRPTFWIKLFFWIVSRSVLQATYFIGLFLQHTIASLRGLQRLLSISSIPWEKENHGIWTGLVLICAQWLNMRSSRIGKTAFYLTGAAPCLRKPAHRICAQLSKFPPRIDCLAVVWRMRGVYSVLQVGILILRFTKSESMKKTWL